MSIVRVVRARSLASLPLRRTSVCLENQRFSLARYAGNRVAGFASRHLYHSRPARFVAGDGFQFQRVFMLSASFR